ncbi:hypothetical protein [Pseudonocardia sp.]|jgi:hypothetical protein|uniref:hypothetical protein n=1 Tax=Pseudonocardia sp. TaxID=60912 RepID=UPI002624F731|nr:hypothetical protein [Pseudonocardia sp.]MCW2716564.1 hypothetical protein [Pseudonocardia sp.]MDT7615783.1 hypothetical protein [Pseudonocardiales bacterium]
MLAGIGKTESDHADGGLVDAGGDTRQPIRGPWSAGAPAPDDLSDTAQLSAAVARCNRSNMYVAALLAWARAYPAPRLLPPPQGLAPLAPCDSGAASAAAAAAVDEPRLEPGASGLQPMSRTHRHALDGNAGNPL